MLQNPESVFRGLLRDQSDESMPECSSGQVMRYALHSGSLLERRQCDIQALDRRAKLGSVFFKTDAQYEGGTASLQVTRKKMSVML